MCRQCDNSPIHALIRNNASLKEIDQEIQNGNVNSRSPCGKSPLMTAAYFCRKDVLELLLERGAVINALDDKTGDTAAHFVTLSLCGHIRQCACLMVLVENGALIDMRNDDGYTVYELADKNGNDDIGGVGESMQLDGGEGEGGEAA